MSSSGRWMTSWKSSSSWSRSMPGRSSTHRSATAKSARRAAASVESRSWEKQQRFAFLLLPHGQGSLRPTLAMAASFDSSARSSQRAVTLAVDAR